MTYLEFLLNRTKESLANELYNHQVSVWADDEKNSEKRIPYIGWFWRDTDFVGKQISIGNAGDLIGVMESNKWGYPERMMTEEEVDTFIAFLERAFKTHDDLINQPNRTEATNAVLKECWDWFQTLKIEG